MELPYSPANAFSYSLKPIRLGEFDLGSVLYHANYFHLYEEIREAFLANSDCSYSSLLQSGNHLAVVEANQKFLKPISYGQTISGKLWTSELKKVSVKFHYTLATNDIAKKNILHYGWTAHAFIHNDKGKFKPVLFPEKLSAALNAISMPVD